MRQTTTHIYTNVRVLFDRVFSEWICDVLSSSSEQSIVAARASVMIYDEGNRRWVPSGSSQGLSKIHIYQHTINNTFRVVGRKLHDHEVLLNMNMLILCWF